MKPVLLYLHGFNSSPGSAKAQQMAAWVAENRPDIEVVIPAQPNTPAAAWAAIEQAIADLKVRHGSALRLGAVGSSLGGFMATRVSEMYGCRAALINPAVRPHELLCDYLGPQTNPYSGERYELLPGHMDELRALAVPVTAPERLWVLQQQEDEVLDYRKALDEYRFARLSLECGGDHAFTGFERYPAQIVRFLGL
ncbi:YqiA/YcfP family alpha/beta fold hydrolase [Aeromonas caviae]|uniref:YqiA/YcfP family alpha/beta fold hydrolase n=1 Tax=Aeromonas caviae TaxID=648 RepID=UPI0004D68E20|nr:YqiA/YcfP family alpha/beta fold hydrolase [Aeromonas caviae]KEP90894.1 esterase [Aeromonas caviae]MDX7648266.1 YqiA/YcfP family alpha/beta fold hydrolase [Aeromonas caviae]